MTYNTATPYIAAHVILCHGNKIAMVLRKNTSWMNGYYGLPSGKVEKGESFTADAVLEASEEVGITIKPADLRPILTVHRRLLDEDMTWVDVFFEADSWQGEVVNVEPDMHSEVAWLDIGNLPDNVIPAVSASLQAIAAGKNYLELGWD